MSLFHRWSRHHHEHHAHHGHDARFGPFGPVPDAGPYGPLSFHAIFHRFGGFGGLPPGWGFGRHGHRHHGHHGHRHGGGHGRHGHPGGHGWGGFGGGLGPDTEGRHGQRLQARASAFLDLSPTQEALLATLFEHWQKPRRAMKALARGPEVARLFEGDNFRRDEAQALFDGQVEALRATSPALVNALADFFDALDFDQQQALRFLMRRLRRRGFDAGAGAGEGAGL
ncbi:hypothetical protein [Roseateles amylovorans]|uniref:Periplasmic heavy metal sensor n=1 Tax=Roseateles amylovorans TaxID=2978473 RepID=A0ABY6ATD2_9BURK|nr:hypothetical protein [Roseateles amylovorans]UXH76272.1 hypothetical protein N4261_14480 [Roseateles amylovorans]